jgi:hypothetical protein
MSGGIFVDKPFSPNLKCIIFALLMVLFYWISSHIGIVYYWLFPLIFVVSYILLAWYDYLYNCSDKMKSGRFGIADSIFKPQLRTQAVSNPINQEKMYQRNVYLFHIIIALPLIMYVSYLSYINTEYKGISALTFGLALVGFIYHLFRFIQLIQ